jgi:phosphoglycolate phosphatase-like HAD superfamily hydrolase
MRGVAESEIDATLGRYLEALAGECAKSAYEPQPGVRELLGRLRARADVLLGLCTGNLERGAQLKLQSAGLWGEFHFGGYGSDAEPRPDIVRAAWSRAQALGATSAIVIGDTPRDVLAAHEAGLPACGVATGRFSVQELLAHGAEIVLPDFSDVAETERLLLAPL